MNKRIWLITGISSGFGASLAAELMQQGDFVIGTFRNESQVALFNGENAGRGHGLLVDVRKTADIDNAIRYIEQTYGRLDVLVNNAGYGVVGAIEETSEAEIRAIFETNFFGALHMTQKALPMMRRQRSGHILQISSGAGFKGTAGFGIYNATKFALEGFSEALADELRPLGIHVTIVEPGPFRTQFAAGSLVQAALEIDDYAPTAGLFRKRFESIDGHQEGDPVKGAQAIIQVVNSAEPPMRLPLGRLVLGNIQIKLDQVKKDLENWRAVAEGTVFQ